MGVDKAGWRATRIAKVTVDVVIGLLIVFAAWVTSTFIGAIGFGWGYRVGLVMLLPILFGFVVLAWLRAFLRDVIAGQVFTIMNAQRLARIGWLLIAIAALRAVAPILMGGVMAFYTPMMILPMLFAVVANTWLVTGLLLLVIAAAWRYGIELQSERDLTV